MYLMLGAKGLWELCLMYSNTFQWLIRFWITVSLHIKTLLTVRKIKTKSMFLNHTCNIMNNCMSKSLINDSNDGTLQLAVLWFWTLYTVWCSQQNALQKLDLFLYADKMVGRNHWIRPLKCSNLNQWIGPSDEITELFYCSNTACNLRCDFAVM
jgi:hypothetical protein